MSYRAMGFCADGVSSISEAEAALERHLNINLEICKTISTKSDSFGTTKKMRCPIESQTFKVSITRIKSGICHAEGREYVPDVERIPIIGYFEFRGGQPVPVTLHRDENGKMYGIEK